MSGQIAPNCRSEGKGCSGTPVVGFSVVRRLKTYLKEKTMSTREKLIKARLGMLALAEELQNISWACRRAGISRSHFYEIKEAFEKWGAEGLAPQSAAQTAHAQPDAAGTGSQNPGDDRAVSHLQLHSHQPAAPADRHRRFAFGGALRLAAARTGGALSALAVAGAQDRGTRRRADRSADAFVAQSAWSARRSRAAHRSAASRAPVVPGYLLRRHHQRRRQDLPADGDRRARFARFRQTVSVESADDRGGCAQRPRAAVLRGAQRGNRTPAHRQWQRILRPSGRASLRALLGDPASRTSAYRHRLAGNQRLLRTFSPHRERGILRRGFPQNVLRIAGAVAARPRCVSGVLQPRARPPGLSHPGPHAVSNLVRRAFANAPRGGETRSCLVYNPRHRSPGVRPSPAKYNSYPHPHAAGMALPALCGNRR